MAMGMEALAVNGPTRDELNAHALPPFSWGRQFPDVQHVGQPATFDFSFERMAPGHALGPPAGGAGCLSTGALRTPACCQLAQAA